MLLILTASICRNSLSMLSLSVANLMNVFVEQNRLSFEVRKLPVQLLFLLLDELQLLLGLDDSRRLGIELNLQSLQLLLAIFDQLDFLLYCLRCVLLRIVKCNF